MARDYKIEDFTEKLRGTRLEALVPFIKFVFYKPEPAPPGLEELYEDAQRLEDQALQLSQNFGRFKVPNNLWHLHSLPVGFFLRDAVVCTRGVRQQLEQLLFGGDPYYTGESDLQKQLERQREMHKEGSGPGRKKP